MKVITLEIDVTVPDNMDDATAAKAVDHLLDAGGFDMLDEVLGLGLTPVINEEIAQQCLQIDISDSTIVGVRAVRG